VSVSIFLDSRETPSDTAFGWLEVSWVSTLPPVQWSVWVESVCSFSWRPTLSRTASGQNAALRYLHLPNVAAMRWREQLGTQFLKYCDWDLPLNCDRLA